MSVTRRGFLQVAGVLAGSTLLPTAVADVAVLGRSEPAPAEGAADYSIRIGASPLEIAPHRIYFHDHL